MAKSKQPVDLKPTLGFLNDLRENNTRAWFEANRPRYEEARHRFAILVAALIHEISRFDDLGWVEPEACIFRIHRDVRFSRDKTPYKPNFGALMGRSGRKGELGYYLHLEGGGQSRLAGGLYAPSPEELARFRTAVARDAAPFKRVIAAASFRRYFHVIEGERVATAPKGYARDHPEIALLQLKQVVALHGVSDAQVLAPDFVPFATRAYKAMHPFLEYLREVTA